MVKAAVLLALAFVASLTLACSSGGGDDKPSQPAGRATAAPTRQATGPSASIEPRSGPPGTEVTVSGRGWPASAPLMVTAAQNPTNAAPYAQLTTGADGSFSAKFRLEKAPDGASLNVGRFDLVARSTGGQVVVPFQVEVPRPVRGPGDGG